MTIRLILICPVALSRVYRRSVTDSQLEDVPRRDWTAWLPALGLVVMFVGLLGALVSEHFAVLASVAASQPRRVLMPSPSAAVGSQIGLQFDPSSAHYVGPDFAGLWIGAGVAALGLAVLIVGIAVTLATRRVD
jgi:hypothetical protein